MLSRGKAVLGLGLILLVHSAFGAPSSVDPSQECKRVLARPGASRELCWKEWLVVVYMAADNDLSPYSFRDIWEMEAVGSSPSVDVVVFQDSAPEDGMRYYHVEKSKNKIDYDTELSSFVKKEGLESDSPQAQEEAFLTARGKSLISSPVLKELPEGDSGDIKTAGDFLRFAMEKYPSRRLMLLGWSHGEGFDAKDDFKDDLQGKQGGFAYDFTSKSHMAVNEMAAGLKRLLAEKRGGNTVDIAGSDACLNQQIEFAYEWLQVADYVFGSSTIVQKKGFNYRTLLTWFTDHPYFETDRLAKEIPLIYGRSVSPHANGKYSSYHDPDATMATWTEAALVPLARALDDLGALLLTWLNNKSAPAGSRLGEWKAMIAKTERLGGVSNDLYNFFQGVESFAHDKSQDAKGKEKELWSAVKVRTNECYDALNRSVLQSFVGEKYLKGLLRTSKGVAIWLPNSQSEYREMFPKFSKSQFYQAKGPGPGMESLSPWAKFVESWYR